MEEGMIDGRSIRLMFVGVLVAGLAACDGSEPLGPEAQTSDGVTSIAVDADLTESIVADGEAAVDALSADGSFEPFAGADEGAIAEARELLRQAREKFAEARHAWQRGDTELAAELAFEGRTLVAEALVLVFGEEAIDRLLRRVEHVITWLEEKVDGEEPELLVRIRELRDEALALREEGDLVGAGERLILALMIADRERIRAAHAQITVHARLAVFIGASSIDLARQVVGEDATDRQAHVLRHANRLVDAAERAFANGRHRLAFGLAHRAVGVTLVAVMLDPDLTEADRVEAMVRLSEAALAAADEAVEAGDPGPLVIRLLERAESLHARGLELADTRPRRAVWVLWYSAVSAHGVVRLLS
jgi:HEPN domain-containing protein